RKRGDLGTDAKVVVEATDALFAVPKRREEAEELFLRHAAAVIGDDAAVGAFPFDSLPLDAEFDLLGTGLECVFEEFARPLIIPARLEHAVNKMRRANDGEFSHVQLQSLDGSRVRVSPSSAFDMGSMAAAESGATS